MGLSPNLPGLVEALATAADLTLYTTDPKLLVAVVAVLTATTTTLLTFHAMKWAASDATMFPQFSREAQSAREDAFLLDTIMGLSDNGQGAPHAGAASRLSVGAAHADRFTCEECGGAMGYPNPFCSSADHLPPADRFARRFG